MTEEKEGGSLSTENKSGSVKASVTAEVKSDSSSSGGQDSASASGGFDQKASASAQTHYKDAYGGISATEQTGASGNLGGSIGDQGVKASGGVNVGGAVTCGNITATDATFSGTLTYDNVTNVDAVGYATFRSGITVQGAGSTTTTLNVSGISTFTGQLNAGTVSATTLIGNGSALTGLPAGFTELDAALFN